MTNTAGTLAGALAVRWGGALAIYAVERLRTEGLLGVSEVRTVAIAGGAMAIAFLEPFDVTLEVGLVKGHIKAFLDDPWQLGVLRDEGMVILLASLFAMALASYVQALGEREAGRKAVSLGVPLICVLEASQLFIGSRMPALWDAMVGSIGIAIGAAMWTASNRLAWPRFWQALLVIMTIVAVAMQQLSPFELAPAYRGFSWYPFFGYYAHTTFETLSHVIELALAFFPLGFCLSLGADSRGRALLAALVLTLAISAPIEYLQGWVNGRYPDISDIGLSLAGAWVGWQLARTDS